MTRAPANAAGVGLCVLAVALCALAISALQLRRVLDAPGPEAGTPAVFRVETGESFTSVLARLGERDLIDLDSVFAPALVAAWARWRGVDHQIKSGEYELDPSLSARATLEHLTLGQIKTWPVTLPEGLRADEVAERLEAANVCDAAGFLAAARDPALARALELPADEAEGYLYPETYRFRRDTPPDEVIARMVAEFRSRVGPADRAALAESGRTLHEVVTLASIVEKETAVESERALIAAVFANRLRRGMRLQTDPTVIYGLVRTRGGFDGNIRRRDLSADTPWNTYTRSGLPSGPIANPTIDSIRAVLAPAEVSYLYFVSRNDGTHLFSNTLVEHNGAVNRYQKRRRRGPS